MPNDLWIVQQAKAELELRRRASLKAGLYLDTDPIRWITENFWVPEIKDRPMPLYPFHEAGLREALAVEPDGKFRYSTVVWSAIKKSIKSTIAAAVALWMAWQNPWSTVKIVANDLKQADSRVFYYINRCLTINKSLGEQARVKNYKIVLPNHSVIEAIPIDPSGEAGANDDLVVYSELWGWRHASAQKMWTETTLSPLKFGRSIRWCETYAGFNGESPILEELYDRGVINGTLINEQNEFYKNDRLLVIWNTKPTCPWQTPEYYKQESSNLLDVEFDRIHRNQWGSSTSAFVPSEWWDSCRVPALPPYEEMEPWIVALDAAIDGDCFGLVAVTRKNGITIVRHIRKWTPPPGGKIMYFAPLGTPPEQDESPAGELRRICERHSVVKVVYDPYQLHSFCSQMKEELIVFFDEFNQGAKRLIADKELRDTIRERHIAHDGDTTLREHILNANAKADGETDKLRIVKRRESYKIDLTVCLSMANYEAVHLNLG